MPKKGKKAQLFPGASSSKQNEKKWALLNQILSSDWKDTAWDTNANKKLKNIENNLKMPYPYFISTKFDSKSGQIKGLDVTLGMHSITKTFDIVQYLKN